MSPKIVDKEMKKMGILTAAMKVFADRGVDKTKMTDIALAAGIGKGTIYEYFRSKEEIFITAFQAMFSQMEEMTANVMKTRTNPVEKLKQVVEISLNIFVEGHSDMAAIMMDFWAEGIRNKDENMMNAINLKGIYRTYRSIFISILDEGIAEDLFKPVDTLSVSALIIAALDGVMLQWIMEPDLLDFKEISAALLDTFLDGIIKK